MSSGVCYFYVVLVSKNLHYKKEKSQVLLLDFKVFSISFQQNFTALDIYKNCATIDTTEGKQISLMYGAIRRFNVKVSGLRSFIF